MALFSIIVPTFNAGDKLARTLDSIRAQDFDDVEILVQDGSSTDGTRDFLVGQDNVKWQSEPDGGIYDAMNRAIGRATGEFLMFFGAGDRMEAGALLELSVAIERERAGQSRALLLLYGDAWWESQNRRHGGRFSQWRFTRTSVCHQAMVFERALFERLGNYDVRYPNSADYAWNILAWGDGGIRKVYVPLLIARYEGGGQSDTSEDTAFLEDVLGLVQRHFSFPVRTLYTLRRKAPRGFKRLLGRR